MRFRATGSPSGKITQFSNFVNAVFPAEPSPSHRRPIDPLRLTTVENPLIDPTEIVISQKSVLKAEPVLTPLGKLNLFLFLKIYFTFFSF